MESMTSRQADGTPPLRTPFWATDLHPSEVTHWRRVLDERTDVSAPGECWNWVGGLGNRGYGRVMVGGRRLAVHRVAWVLANQRALTHNLTVDHLCRNRACVNPEHLEAVTIRVNSERARDVAPGLRALLNQSKDAGRDARGWLRRWCPVCNVAYGSRMLPEHIRSQHPEAI